MSVWMKSHFGLYLVHTDRSDLRDVSNGPPLIAIPAGAALALDIDYATAQK